jgi:hypothetical protein
MVTGPLAEIPEAFNAAGGDHEYTTLLQRIAGDARLAEAGSPGG